MQRLEGFSAEMTVWRGSGRALIINYLFSYLYVRLLVIKLLSYISEALAGCPFWLTGGHDIASWTIWDFFLIKPLLN